MKSRVKSSPIFLLYPHFHPNCSLLLIFLGCFIPLQFQRHFTLAHLDLDLSFGEGKKSFKSVHHLITLQNLVVSVSRRIVEVEGKCDSLNFILDTRTFQSGPKMTRENNTNKNINLVQWTWLDFDVKTVLKFFQLSTILTLPLENPESEAKVGYDYPRVLPILWPEKFVQYCTVVLATVDPRVALFKGGGEEDNEETAGFLESVREHVIFRMPSEVYQTYFIWLPGLSESESEGEELSEEYLKNLRVYTRYIQNQVFAFVEKESEKQGIENCGGDVSGGGISLKTPNWDFSRLDQVAYFSVLCSANKSWSGETRLFPKYPDFMGNVVLGLGCPVCTPKYEEFLQTNVWTDYMIATMYYMSVALNATIEFNAVFSLPNDGRDEEGNWNEYIAPLIDGSAAMSSMLRPSMKSYGICFFSKIVFYDSISFIHALPKLNKFMSIWVLYEPLSPRVWLGLALSFLLVALTLEFFAYFYERHWKKLFRNNIRNSNSNLSSPFPYPAFTTDIDNNNAFSASFFGNYFPVIPFALWESLIEQSALQLPSLQRRITKGWSRFTLSLWLLLLITLSCGYKSKLISSFTKPHQVFPPRTFAALAESDYEIGAMFWINAVEDQFIELNSSFGRSITGKAKEYPYFNNECYHLIFTGKKVCMGFTAVFYTLGKQFLTSAKKEPLFMISLDQYFPFVGSIGLSKYFPYIVQPFDEFVRRFESTGIYIQWNRNAIVKETKTGRTNAGNWMAEKPHFRGSSAPNTKMSFLFLLFQILAIGMTLAAFLFILEHIFRKMSTSQIIQGHADDVVFLY